MGKILLIITIIVSLLTAGVGYMNYTKLQETKEELGATSARTESTEASLAQTKSDLSKSQEELAASTEENTKLQAQLKTAQTEAAQNKTLAEQSAQQLQEKETELEQLKTDMTAKDTRIAELEASSVGSAPNDPSAVNTMEMETRITEQETLIQKLQGDLAASRSQLEEYKERESNRAAQVMRGGLEGKVLAVNQAWNFVVLSLGDRNGVVSNAEMLVKRGNQLVGKVRITSVEPSTSIADIVANSTPRGLVIQPGDNVIYVGVQE